MVVCLSRLVHLCAVGAIFFLPKLLQAANYEHLPGSANGQVLLPVLLFCSLLLRLVPSVCLPSLAGSFGGCVGRMPRAPLACQLCSRCARLDAWPAQLAPRPTGPLSFFAVRGADCRLNRHSAIHTIRASLQRVFGSWLGALSCTGLTVLWSAAAMHTLPTLPQHAVGPSIKVMRSAGFDVVAAVLF